MKIYFIKTKHGLAPRFDSDQEALDLIKNGKVFMKDFKLVRNPDFNGAVFKFLNLIFKHQDQFDDFEQFRERVKWYTGCYRTYMIDDKVITELSSWEFGKMKELEFRSLFKRIKTACWEKFVPYNNLSHDQQRAFEDELLEFDKWN